MKNLGAYKIWQVIYPIGMYYVVSSIVYFLIGVLIGNEPETYMLRQMLCGACTIPVTWSFYREIQKLEDVVYGREKTFINCRMVWNVIVSLLTGAMFGIAVNNFIAMTPLIQVSEGFHEANSSFFAGGVIFELLGSCLVIPIAEELLYRGVVYKRLRLLVDVLPAILLSALVFGLMHGNMVQLLYAGILGLLLVYLMQSTGKLYAPILGHIAANVMAVVRQETGWLDFAYEPTIAGIGFSVLLVAGTVGLLLIHYRTIKNTGLFYRNVLV